MPARVFAVFVLVCLLTAVVLLALLSTESDQPLTQMPARPSIGAKPIFGESCDGTTRQAALADGPAGDRIPLC